MIETGASDYLLFDGDCGICTYLSDVAKRMDKGRRFVVEPYQRFPEEELMRFRVTYAKCTKRLYVITRKGRAWGGAFGLNYFLFHQPLWAAVVVLIYAVPVLLLLEIIGYRIVARNRHRLSRWFGMKACLLKR
ncbi:MAG TPA: DCC1-like thiol-disulfide oxidoreductase family protein [Blastocatellia bacterium]|nr:DCC1-like thiol-disulfide oxidoreductase family protein [Blastocatellia bacterium]